jgi:RNA polymerase sigma-70 factor (ECF subfamily)
MIYCLMARAVPESVRAAVARAYECDPNDEPIVERRADDRRRRAERRTNPWDPILPRTNKLERRTVRNLDGRRVAERRGVLLPLSHMMDLPRPARRWADHISFAGFFTGTPDWEDDVASERLVIRIQGGDTSAFEHLYKLWFNRVYGCLRATISDPIEVEGELQNVFGELYDSIEDYDPRVMPFRSWLGAIVASRDDSGSEILDDDQDRWAERWPAHADSHAFDWLSDEELFLLVSRLPSMQRRIVVLHYFLGVGSSSLAHLFDAAPAEVSEMHARALRFMSACVAAANGRPGYSGRHPMRAQRRPATVIRQRRLALMP